MGFAKIILGFLIVAEVILGGAGYYWLSNRHEQASDQEAKIRARIASTEKFARTLKAYPGRHDETPMLEAKYVGLTGDLADLFLAHRIVGRITAEQADPRKPVSALFKPVEHARNIKRLDVKIDIEKYAGWSYVLGVIESVLDRYPLLIRSVEFRDGRIAIGASLYGRTEN